MIQTVEGLPVNGIDTSQYQDIRDFNTKPDWLRFWGIKAADLMKTPVMDPNFLKSRRIAREGGVPYRSFYVYLRDDYTAAENVEALWDAVGELDEGESVYLDWEDPAYSRHKFEETLSIMDRVYSNRYFTYVNNVTQDMESWMEWRRDQAKYSYPLMYPQWNEDGMGAAIGWGAMIWQVGIARDKECMPVTKSDCDVNWILQESTLAVLCTEAGPLL